ncbi:MAG: nucleoside-diphosphate kinase [Nanoarchaeota archaeon]
MITLPKSKDEIIVVVHPWCFTYSLDILSQFDNAGLRLKERVVERVPSESIRKHYSFHQGQPYFEPLVKAITGRPVRVAHYLGDYDVFTDLKLKVRERYNLRIQQVGTHVRAAVHASRNRDEFVNEILAWREFLH